MKWLGEGLVKEVEDQLLEDASFAYAPELVRGVAIVQKNFQRVVGPPPGRLFYMLRTPLDTKHRYSCGVRKPRMSPW